MSYFKAKMQQIRFRLGLRPDPAGELTALPTLDLRGPTSKKGRGGEGRGREGEDGKAGEGRGGVHAWKFFKNISP